MVTRRDGQQGMAGAGLGVAGRLDGHLEGQGGDICEIPGGDQHAAVPDHLRPGGETAQGDAPGPRRWRPAPRRRGRQPDRRRSGRTAPAPARPGPDSSARTRWSPGCRFRRPGLRGGRNSGGGSFDDLGRGAAAQAAQPRQDHQRQSDDRSLPPAGWKRRSTATRPTGSSTGERRFPPCGPAPSPGSAAPADSRAGSADGRPARRPAPATGRNPCRKRYRRRRGRSRR